MWVSFNGVVGGRRGEGVPFHSKPSCSLKNSRNAGSSSSEESSLVVCFEELAGTTELRRSAAGVGDRERHIWARSPSSWRRPLRILTPS